MSDLSAGMARFLHYYLEKNRVMKKRIMQFAGIISILLLLNIIISACSSTSPTASKEISAKTYNIAGGDWVFTANSANPRSGITKQLSGGYTVTYTAKKLIAYLPYFGQASAGADLFAGHGPLDFTSTNFVSEQHTTKDGWNITIKPRDYSEVESMDFTFYENGNAYLRIMMLNRSPISFNGSVEQIKS